MIIKEYGSEKMVCDYCDVSEHIIEGDFNLAVSDAKGDGWKITRPEGQWHHVCPSCALSDGRLAAAQARFGINPK